MPSAKETLSARLRRHRRLLDALVALFWVALFLMPYAVQHNRVAPFLAGTIGPLRAIDDYFADVLARNERQTPRNPDIVFLGIDDASERLDALDPEAVKNDPALSKMANFPWPREVYGMIYDRLIQSGARVVLFDLLFQQPKPASDALFKAALDRAPDQFVLSCNFVPQPPRPPPLPPLPEQLASPSDTIIPQTAPPDPRIAFVNFWPDIDNTIRSACYHHRYAGSSIGAAQSDWLIDSMAATACHILKRDAMVPVDEAQHRMRFTQRTDWGDGKPRSFATYSVYQIFDPDSWKNNFQNGAFFRDKIVMVGPKGNFQQDQHLTPLGLMDGAEVHLHSLNAALNGEFFWETADHFGWMVVLTACAGLLAYVIVLGVKGVFWQISLATVGGAAYLAASMGMFDHNVIPAVAAPIGTLIMTMTTALIGQFLLEQMEKARTRQFFERYVSPKVVGQILDNPKSYVDSLVGVRRPVTVLFSDLRGFTSMTESADTEQLVRDLNEYLEEMTNVLFENDGILDKFIGDAVMAVWGSFTPRPEIDACSAVAAALGMHRALVRLNVRRGERGAPAFAMGVGINHGDAIVGDIGSSQQTNFTVIGDSVNLASRLESATKEYGVETLISESMAALVRPHFHLQTVDSVVVKGRTKPVEVFTVHGAVSEKLAPERTKYLVQFELAMKQYRNQKFAEAKTGFAACTAIFPADKLSKMYVDRCAEFLLTPPPQPWDGVFVMKTK